MAVFVAYLVLVLAMACHSDASYCVCNSGLSDTVLQTNIDYACGNGADCSAIQQNGACFNPNTFKDHCNYAVNSYYQRKNQVPGSCNFSSSASVTPNAPTAAAGCVYQSSPSNGGSTTPPSFGGTPPNSSSVSPPGMVTGPIVPPGPFDNNGIIRLHSQITITYVLALFSTFLIHGLARI